MSEQSTIDRFARFRSARHAAVQAPTGPLALVNTQWVEQPQTIWGVPGRWAPRADGAPGLHLDAAAADGIRFRGETVDGGADIPPRDDDPEALLGFADGTTGFVIRGPESRFALRVWDAGSDANRAFDRIEAYRYDPAWVLHGVLRPNPEGTSVAFRHVHDGDATRDEAVPSDIEVEIGGEVRRLAAFPSGRRLQLVFADRTTGEETYGVGRFLFVEPGDDGAVTLDFNEAVLPPCAFSEQFNCPIPPAQNRLPVAIRAGEKQVVDADGVPLH